MTTTNTAAEPVTRITADLDDADYVVLRRLALENRTSGVAVVRALIRLAGTDPATAQKLVTTLNDHNPTQTQT